MGAQIVTPVREGERLLGIISLHHMGGPREWSERELAIPKDGADLSRPDRRATRCPFPAGFGSLIGDSDGHPRIAVERHKSIVVSPANSHNRIWPDLEPVATSIPARRSSSSCATAWTERSAARRRGALETVDFDTNHPLTGPVEVRGAAPGDVLVVDAAARIVPDGFGTTAVVPGFGLLGDLFRVVLPGAVGDRGRGRALGADCPGSPSAAARSSAASRSLRRRSCSTRATAREAALARTGRLCSRPQPRSAVPAVEPYASNALRTIPPRENGGNLDVAQVREGSRLLLPVHVPGALLSIGDMHFAQGEGEGSATAIESRPVTVRVSLRRADDAAAGARVPRDRVREQAPEPGRRPCFQTPGIPLDDDGANGDMDLRLAARRALQEMIGWLAAERGLTREQAYVLTSVAADLRVAEAVNVPNGARRLPAAARRLRVRPAEGPRQAAEAAAPTRDRPPARGAAAPRSRVRVGGPARAGVDRPASIARGAASSPRNSSIIATDRSRRPGWRCPRPAMSGAEPWTAWKRLGWSASGSRLALGADAQAAGRRRGEVGEDVAEEVAGHDHVERTGWRDAAGRQGVDQEGVSCSMSG